MWLTGKAPRGFPSDLLRRSLGKLQALNAAISVEKMASPLGNRLELLRGNYAGKWSVRINDQWRLVFRFEGQHAYDVEIVDYH